MKKPSRITVALIGWALASLCCFGNPAFALDLGQLEFKNCELGKGITRTEAQCAYLEVPENRAEPNKRLLKIHVALIASRSRKVEADPVVMLAGGPGQAASESFSQIAHAFDRILEKRHVLLIDQRGTGLSHKLECDDDSDPESHLTGDTATEIEAAALEALRTGVQKCAVELSKRADLRFYTTTDATLDLEDLRKATGAPQLNLVGFSYGTRVAQQFAMHFPNSTRSLIIDGIAPNQLILGSEHAQNLEVSLAQHFNNCTSDPACQKRFGNPAETLSAVRAQLKLDEREVRINDPFTGKPKTVKLSHDRALGVLRFYAYGSQFAALIPLLLDEAKLGRVEPLLAQTQMAGEDVQSAISLGMHFSVTCAEDAEFLKINAADRDTLLGNQLPKMLIETCKLWPKGARAKDFFEPLKSSIPSLLISGEYDPVTPARYGDDVIKNLSNAKHIVVPKQGHINLSAGCMPKIAARFLDTLKPAELKTKCVARIKPAPFFLEFTGPSP
jgi:pimeloyl-ACP methyl ester carboxylesterase